MPGLSSTLRVNRGATGSYGLTSPQKFNPLSKESPLMKVDKRYIKPNRTMSRFHDNRKSQENIGTIIPNIKTLALDNTNANVRGKLKQLEAEILEINQVLNYHKKEVDILRHEKETLQQVLNK